MDTSLCSLLVAFSVPSEGRSYRPGFPRREYMPIVHWGDYVRGARYVRVKSVMV